MKFGLSEVIRPISLERIMSEKTLYMFGDPKYKVEKVANSYKPTDHQEVLAQCIKAIKEFESGNTEYVAIELFKDMKRPVIEHVNVCHMRQVE